jgi:hypothetical protein
VRQVGWPVGLANEALLLPVEGPRMNSVLADSAEPFIERRSFAGGATGQERRQFANSHEELSPEARELAQAIDGYKLMHRRRFITFEEMLAVIKELGYSK